MFLRPSTGQFHRDPLFQQPARCGEELEHGSIPSSPPSSKPPLRPYSRGQQIGRSTSMPSWVADAVARARVTNPWKKRFRPRGGGADRELSVRGSSERIRRRPEQSSEFFPKDLRLAAPRRRLQAFFIDSLIFVVIFLAPSIGSEVVNETAGYALVGVWVMLTVGFIVVWLYGAAKGWNPGKLAMKLRIVDIEGSLPGWRTPLLREIIGKPISTLPLLLGHMGIWRDPLGQCWHDKIAYTVVVTKS